MITLHARVFAIRVLAVVIAALVVLQPTMTSAQAIGAEDLNALKRTSEWYSTKSYTSCNSSGSVTLRGSDNAERVYNFLVDKGLKPFQAAGVMGNIEHESGFEPQRQQSIFDRPVPAESFPDPAGASGWGLVQWTPGSKFISTQNPISQANDLGVQLVFLWDQLEGRTPIPEKKAGDDVKATTTVEQAVLAFQGGPRQQIGGQLVGPYTGYERPADKTGSIPDRYAAAKDYLALYGSNAPTPGSTSPATPADVNTGCAAGGGSLGVGAGGFTFPLKTTQGRIKNQQPWHWCYDKQTNCHHDYPAADIFTDVGTEVVAVVGGEVITSAETACNGRIGGSSNLQIKGTDGNYYFYTHMQGGLDAHKGDTVTAGQVLGRVGPAACAQNTVPHIHFQAYNDVIRGNAQSTNVQPALVEAFNALQP